MKKEWEGNGKKREMIKIPQGNTGKRRSEHKRHRELGKLEEKKRSGNRQDTKKEVDQIPVSDCIELQG